jgi:hypothetical protein
MALLESKATALIRFMGLGLVVFNKEKQRGEIGVIRDEKHNLSIKIQEPRFVEGSEKDLILYEDVATYKDLQKEGVSIEISTKGNSGVNGYEIYQSEGEFNRLECEDLNDYRWLVNFNEIHNESLGKSNNQEHFPLTKVSIENGLFYVHKLDTDLYFEKLEKNETGETLNREAFGNIAETIGVCIEADEVVFKITVGVTEQSYTIFRKSGLPSRILIENMSYDENAVVSDLPDYYKYFETGTRSHFELEPIIETEVGGGVSGKSFCHPLGCDGDFIDSIDDFEG